MEPRVFLPCLARKIVRAINPITTSQEKAANAEIKIVICMNFLQF
jgi:hypothetical protein